MRDATTPPCLGPVGAFINLCVAFFTCSSMGGGMAASRLALTTEDRSLLYLSDFKGMEDRFELPVALTQKSVAFAAGIHRKHVSRYLDELVREGAGGERKAPIGGLKQRMPAHHPRPP